MALLCCSYTFTNRLANVRRTCTWNCLECHSNATASKAYVAVTLHDRQRGDRAAEQLRELSMLWRCRGFLSDTRYAIRLQVDS